MIRLICDDIVRRYITAHPSHPYVVELSEAVIHAKFEFTRATLEDVNIAIGKLMVLTGGDIQCVIEPGEADYPVEGHA